MLKNSSICMFLSASFEENNITIEVKRLLNINNYFTTPFQSKYINIFHSNGDLSEIEYVNATDIYCKMFAVILSENNELILTKIIHSHDMKS